MKQREIINNINNHDNELTNIDRLQPEDTPNQNSHLQNYFKSALINNNNNDNNDNNLILAFNINKDNFENDPLDKPIINLKSDYAKYIPKVNEITQLKTDQSPVIDGIPKGYANITDMCMSGIQTEDLLKFKKLMSPAGQQME